MLTKIQKKQIGLCALIIGVLAIFCGCGKRDVKQDVKEPEYSGVEAVSLTDDVEAEQVEEKEPDEKFILSAADFSIELFKNSVNDAVKNGQNVLISPESVMTALAMTANGAAGDTLTDMEQVLSGNSGISIDELNQYMLGYNANLTESEDVTFHIANSIWMRDSDIINVNQDFLQTDKNYYDADAFTRPFDISTVDEINGWVNDNTNGMIDTLLEEIPPNAVMYLINAVAFEGEWEAVYEDYQINEAGEFTNASGTKETVTMLDSTENVYIEDKQATGFVKPYNGGQYAFMAILPEENIALSDYIAQMDGSDFISMYNNRSYEEVIVKLPEFTYEYEKELSDTLTGMGMGSAFEEDADFSRMAETDTGMLFIGKILHKTFIEVDREGTRAAAVTSIEMDCNSVSIDEELPKAVFLDRPFVYAIIDTDTGLPVFIGAVNSVKK